MNRFTKAAVRRNRTRDEYFMQSKTKPWYVYIVECSDTTLYTGITNDLTRRINEHNNTHKAAKYTRARRPVKLICYVSTRSRSEALKLEAAVKKKKRKDKINFMKTFNCTEIK